MTVRFLGTGDPDLRAWMAAVGPVGAAQQSATAALVASLKGSGVWPTLDRLWLFASENATQALTDLVARASATAVGGPTFTAGRGYTAASGKYVNSGFNPASGTPNYTRNSASYGLWIETADTNAGSRPMGNDSAAASEFVVSSPNYLFGVNQGSNGASAVAASTTGCMDSVRTGASATTFYANGVQTATNAIASIAIPSQSFFILASDNAGSPSSSAVRGSAAWIGGSRTPEQGAAVYVALRAYMTVMDVA